MDVLFPPLSRRQRPGTQKTEGQQHQQREGFVQAQTKSSFYTTQAGFLDGGASATFDELLKSLNKALAKADPQQASVVLSHILEKSTLTLAERNKFGIMKCKILFGYF